MTPCIADTGAQRLTNAHIYIYIIFIDLLLQKDCFTISEGFTKFIGRKWSWAITKTRSKSMAVWLWRASHRRHLHSYRRHWCPTVNQCLSFIYIYIFLFFIDLLLQKDCFTISEGFTTVIFRKPRALQVISRKKLPFQLADIDSLRSQKSAAKARQCGCGGWPQHCRVRSEASWSKSGCCFR